MVLAGNIIGTWLLAAALTMPGVFDPDVTAALTGKAREALQHPPLPVFVRAVVAGWLIALMVWLLPSSRSARLWVVILMTYLIGVGELPHIIAGSTEAAYAVLTGHAAFAGYAGVFFLPTLLGNVVGGVALVALLNHAPVAEEVRREHPEPSEHGPLAGSDPADIRGS